MTKTGFIPENPANLAQTEQPAISGRDFLGLTETTSWIPRGVVAGRLLQTLTGAGFESHVFLAITAAIDGIPRNSTESQS
jgi:hypothetical protein